MQEYDRTGQAISDNIIRHIALHARELSLQTHSEYSILIVCQKQSDYSNTLQYFILSTLPLLLFKLLNSTIICYEHFEIWNYASNVTEISNL
jgi:hypothetical protein